MPRGRRIRMLSTLRANAEVTARCALPLAAVLSLGERAALSPPAAAADRRPDHVGVPSTEAVNDRRARAGTDFVPVRRMIIAR